MPIPFAAFDHTKAIDKSGAPFRVYGLWGDAFLQEQALNLILELSLDPDARDFNMDVLDGETTKITDLLASTSNYPFLSDRRVIIVKRAEKMEGLARGEDGGKKKTSKSGASPAQQLTAGLKNLPETTVLVLQRTPETPDIGDKPGERCINAAIDKVIDDGTKSSSGLLVNCVVPAKSPAFAAGIIEFQARTRGILLARGAAAYLVERCGSDIAFLIGELEKCALSAGTNSPVTPAVINEMTQPLLQDTIWDLMDFIGSKQGGKAITALRELYERGEAPERIMVNIVSLLRQLLQARTFLDLNLPLDASLARRLPPQLAAQLPTEYKDSLAMQLPSQSWKAPKLTAQAKRFTVPQLQRALELVFEADLASKGIEGDGGFESKEASSAGLEILVAKLCGA